MPRGPGPLCCFCCDTKTGLIVIAVLTIVAAVFSLGISGYHYGSAVVYPAYYLFALIVYILSFAADIAIAALLILGGTNGDGQKIYIATIISAVRLAIIVVVSFIDVVITGIIISNCYSGCGLLYGGLVFGICYVMVVCSLEAYLIFFMYQASRYYGC